MIPLSYSFAIPGIPWQLFEILDKRQQPEIRRRQAECSQFLRGSPATGSMLPQTERAAEDSTPERVEIDAQTGTFMVDQSKEITHANLPAKLLRYFSRERLFKGFARFDLATREFPHQSEFLV